LECVSQSTLALAGSLRLSYESMKVGCRSPLRFHCKNHIHTRTRLVKAKRQGLRAQMLQRTIVFPHFLPKPASTAQFAKGAPHAGVLNHRGSQHHCLGSRAGLIREVVFRRRICVANHILGGIPGSAGRVGGERGRWHQWGSACHPQGVRRDFHARAFWPVAGASLL
jgi:hypothetical protein